MDFDGGNFVQILIAILFVFLLVARGFYNVFFKRSSTGQPGQGPQPRGQMREFLDELRRDLGHGKTGPPRTDRILEVEEDEELEEERRAISRPAPPQPEPAAPAPLVRRAPLAERRARQEEAARAAMAQLLSQRANAETESILAADAPPAQEARLATSSVSTVRRTPGTVLGIDLQAAIVLKEVFGPPRALRNSRRRAWR